jgi:hypothetical protein
MGTKYQVIGWLFDDNAARVLVREENGHVSSQAANTEGAFAHQAIQTGSFRRGNPIIDPVTHETLGYELVPVSSLLAAQA